MPFQHSSDSLRQKNLNKEEKAVRCEQPSPPTEPPEISNIWTLIPSIFVRSSIHPLLCKVSYMRMKYPKSKIRSSQEENQSKETNDWCCCCWWWWWCSCCRRTIHPIPLCTFFHQYLHMFLWNTLPLHSLGRFLISLEIFETGKTKVPRCYQCNQHMFFLQTTSPTIDIKDEIKTQKKQKTNTDTAPAYPSTPPYNSSPIRSQDSWGSSDFYSPASSTHY